MAKPKGASAPSIPIRRGMDVFSAYQNQYLGTVVRVWHGAVDELGTNERNATAQMEQDAEKPAHGLNTRRLLGEDLGPFPTRIVGNTGPENQAAGQRYATAPHTVQPGVVYFAVRPSRPGVFNPFARRLYIPSSAILSFSMERIIVEMQPDRMPAAWHQPPK